MSSMCYPVTMQCILDDYCQKAGRERLVLQPNNAEKILKEVMSDRPKGVPGMDSLRRSVIARLAYYCGRARPMTAKKVWETCPVCGRSVRVSSKRGGACDGCHSMVRPCSVCLHECSACPFERKASRSREETREKTAGECLE